MRTRRLENVDKNRFWEVFWELGDVEVVSGALGTKGRAKRHELAPAACEAFVEKEVAAKLKQGFVEVMPELDQTAPRAPAAPRWLDRIAEAFDDDQPRLVYADWLQAQGDPLGELIAVQCHAERVDRWEPRHRVLRERAESLLASFRRRWIPNFTGVEIEFRRGFPERARFEDVFDPITFDHVVDAAPLLRSLEVDGQRLGWRAIVAWWSHPTLQLLTGLFLRGFQYTRPQLEALVDSPTLAGVTRLGLRSCGLGASEIKLLARRAWIDLDLHQNVLGARGVEHALAAPSRLATLDLGSSGVGDDGALILASAPLPALRELSLRRSNLTARSLGPLARAPGLASLRELDLSCNALDADAVAALFDAPALPNLVALDLRETGLDDAAIVALCRSPLASQLASLELGQNAITATGAQALAEAELPSLRYLNVSSNPLEAAANPLKAALKHARVVARGIGRYEDDD